MSTTTGYPPDWPEIKDRVREEAGHRCVRCGHPYRKGDHGTGEWSPCDDLCDHDGDGDTFGAEYEGSVHALAIIVQATPLDRSWLEIGRRDLALEIAQKVTGEAAPTLYSRWRILTVHHLDGDKQNCRWWNLAALCQRCHLRIQGRVKLETPWSAPHSEWFRPYVAGYYAFTLLGQEPTREDVNTRLEELLELGAQHAAAERLPIYTEGTR